MNEIPNIIAERVDDIPLLIEQMQRMGLPTLFDTHFPTHGNWTGLSLGWGSTIWLSSMLSRGDHRMVHVEPWVAKRLWTLRVTTGQAVRCVDFTDDRLEIVLRRLSDDTRWAAFESALNQHTVRVYDLSTARVHVDSPSASVYATASEGGVFQCGPSKDERRNLPQVKGVPAVLDPLGMPLATDVVSGERADDPLYLPCIARVQASRGRHGLFYVGDCKMASRDTRARIAAAGDVYLCPRPQVQLDQGEFDAALEAVGHGEHVLSPVVREGPKGQPEVIAEGDEYPVAMRQKGEGQGESWTERRVVVRSVRQAHAAEAALRARVGKAMAQIEALNQRGRGKHSLVVNRLAGVDAGGMCRSPSVGDRRGETGWSVCRQSEARNRPPHSRAFARSVSGHHAHHHQGAPTDRSTYDGSEPAPTASSGDFGLFFSALYKALHRFFGCCPSKP